VQVGCDALRLGALVGGERVQLALTWLSRRSSAGVITETLLACYEP
jgi:hypothetical protein